MRRLVLVGQRAAMARRSTPQSKIDDLAFPIRVKFVVPPFGLRGMSARIQEWLKAELGHLAYAWHPSSGYGCNATAFYFRSLADAARFVEAFPELQMADAIETGVYRSPAKAAGEDSRGRGWETAGRS